MRAATAALAIDADGIETASETGAG
jgi:hypothetical protein